MRVLVTRPQPGADATAARLHAAGHVALVAPLLATEALAWTVPDPLPPAVMLTSAAAARLFDAHAAPPPALLARPCFAVGAATAAAARAAGFRDVRAGGGNAQALVDGIAAAGIAELLHLAGEDRSDVVVPAGLSIVTRVVYAARLLPLARPAPFDVAWLFSARTAAHFAAECDRLGLARDDVAIAAISPAVAAAAGPGWRRIDIAASPDESALLATLAAPCNKPG